MTHDSFDVGWLERDLGRRGFLRGSLGGLVLLALGGLWPAGCRSYPMPPVPLRFFSRDEYAVFRAVARVMLGLEDDSTDIAIEVDGLLARMERSVRRDIHWILRIFEHGTHLFDLKEKRFTRLSAIDQEKYLSGWMTSSLGARRIVFRALKLLSSLGYYGRSETWKKIGYDGPWIGRREAQGRAVFESVVSLGSLPSK